MMTDFATLEDLQQADPLFQEIQRLRAALEAAPQPETFFKQDSFAADYADWHERVLKPALEQEREPESLQQKAR
jgi:hypothetical protein